MTNRQIDQYTKCIEKLNERVARTNSHLAHGSKLHPAQMPIVVLFEAASQFGNYVDKLQKLNLIKHYDRQRMNITLINDTYLKLMHIDQLNNMYSMYVKDYIVEV